MRSRRLKGNKIIYPLFDLAYQFRLPLSTLILDTPRRSRRGRMYTSCVGEDELTCPARSLNGSDVVTILRVAYLDLG